MSDKNRIKMILFSKKKQCKIGLATNRKKRWSNEDGLELIEFLSVDCTATDGEWHSDSEI